MAKAFSDTWIRKFKGINYNPPEQAGMEDEVFPAMQNWNVHPEGYLVKRPGASLMNTFSGLATSKVLGIARGNPSGLVAAVICTDSTKVYRASLPGVTSITEIVTAGPASLTAVNYMVQYGSPSTPYYSYLLRSNSTPNGIWQVTGPAGGYAATLVTNAPGGTHMSVFKDRGWVCDNLSTTGTESRLWYSAAGDLTNWGGAGLPQNIDFNPGDGDYLVATVPYNDTLLVFKSRKVYVLYADGSPTSWTVRLLNGSIGCTGRDSVQVINGFVYFLSADGVYKTDGTTFQLLSDNVRSVTSQNRDYRSPATVNEVYSAYWDDKYILWIPSASNTQPLIWDLRSETWTRWLFAGSVDMKGCARYNEYNPDTLYMGARVTNKVWALGPSGYQDDGNNYTCSFTTRTMDFGDYSSLKRNHITYLDVAPNFNAGTTYTVSYRADENAVAGGTGATDVNYRKLLRVKGAGYHRTLQTSVSVLDQYSATIYGIGWATETKGRAKENIP